MKEKIFNAFRIVVLAFILSSAIGYSLADWTPPSGTPPFNNVPPPINVGPTTQVKDGNLFINNLLWAKKARSVSTDAADTGDTLVTKDYVDGKVGASATGVYVHPATDYCGGTAFQCGTGGDYSPLSSNGNPTWNSTLARWEGEFFKNECGTYRESILTKSYVLCTE